MYGTIKKLFNESLWEGASGYLWSIINMQDKSGAGSEHTIIIK